MGKKNRCQFLVGTSSRMSIFRTFEFKKVVYSRGVLHLMTVLYSIIVRTDFN